jgi:uncharacterized membrane protein
MELCILKFPKTHQADQALDQAIASHGDDNRWLYEVAVVKRPPIGRISIRATFGDVETGQVRAEVRQGDIAATLKNAGGWTGYLAGSLGGPLRARLSTHQGRQLVAPAAEKLERDIMGIDEIKQMLPRGSSALVYLGRSEDVDRLIAFLSSSNPETIRRGVSDDLMRELENVVRESEAAAE